MKGGKKVFAVIIILALCVASFANVFFGKSEKVEAAKAIANTVSYDRNAAVSFAASYYNQVCPDGFYSTTSDCKESDCAHFVSCAIGDTYGGGGISLGWNRNGIPCTGKSYYGFTSSSSLSSYLYDNGYTDEANIYRVYVYDDNHNIIDPDWENKIVNYLSTHTGDQYKGDVIFFVYTNNRGGHTALYLGNYQADRSRGSLAQHSYGSSTIDVQPSSNCWGCNIWGHGSYDEASSGPISFISYMRDHRGVYVNRFAYYHINTTSTNNPPTLSSGGVSPLSGTTSTLFTYSVHYYDPEGATPASDDCTVGIDGSYHNMTLSSGTPFNGTYTYQTTLSIVGTHYYWFEFSDGVNAVTLPPGTDNYSGPTVSSCIPPSTPSLSSPSNGLTGVSLTPTFSWSASSGTTPITYTLQISTNSSFSSYVFNQSVGSVTSYPLPSGVLNYNTTYYWRVQAVNSCGSPTSSYYYFTTNAQVSGEPKSIHTWLYGPNDQDIYSYDVDIRIDSFLTNPNPDFLYFWSLCVYFNDGSAAHGGLQWASGGKKANWGGYGLVGGTQSIVINYPWETGKYYRYRVWRLSQKPDGSFEWGFWILDYSTNIETYVGKVTSWGSLINNVVIFTETGYGVQCDTPTVRVRWKSPKYNSVSGGTNLIPTKGLANYNGTCVDPNNTDQRLISTNPIEFIHLTNTTRTILPNTYLFNLENLPPSSADSIGVFRPSEARFYLRSSTGTVTGIQFGRSTDIPIIGDWDGNGTDEIGVYRPSSSAFFLRYSNGTVSSPIYLGNSLDLPIIGDWDGNGTDEVGVYRPSSSAFFLRYSNGTVSSPIYLGNSGDLPIIGDWDGNGTDDIGIFRPSNNGFFLRSSTGTVPSPIFLGNSDDKPIIGKW
jgi:hypothetical protein